LICICYGSDLNTKENKKFIEVELKKDYQKVKGGKETLSKTECGKMFDSNLNEARKAVTEIFESNGKKVSCG
jgi:hypothetical protein